MSASNGNDIGQLIAARAIDENKAFILQAIFDYFTEMENSAQRFLNHIPSAADPAPSDRWYRFQSLEQAFFYRAKMGLHAVWMFNVGREVRGKGAEQIAAKQSFDLASTFGMRGAYSPSFEIDYGMLGVGRAAWDAGGTPSDARALGQGGAGNGMASLTGVRAPDDSSGARASSPMRSTNENGAMDPTHLDGGSPRTSRPATTVDVDGNVVPDVDFSEWMTDEFMNLD